MSPIERLRAFVAYAPKGTTVTVESLAELLNEAVPTPAKEEQAKSGDLTAKDIAAQLSRSSSTIRAWLGAGEVPGAYRFRGREWRVPQVDFERFLQRQREGAEPVPGDSRLETTDLGAWRKVHRDAA